MDKPIWFNEVDPLQEEYMKLIIRGQDLGHEANLVLIKESELYDFSKPIKNQIMNEEMRRKELTSKYYEYEKDVKEFIKNNWNDLLIDSELTRFQAPFLSEILKGNDPILAARVMVPSKKAENINVSLELSLDQLRDFHRTLL